MLNRDRLSFGVCMRLLFLCSQNRLRSPTAEHIFAQWPDLEADSAGLDRDANVMLSSEQVEWADIVFVMEAKHRQKLKKNFERLLRDKRVICLNIPDDYDFMQPELVELLELKVGQYLK